MIKLYSHQIEALRNMHNGCILNGDVGSGKSITAIAYYYLKNGGSMEDLMRGEYSPCNSNPSDLYIITTAHKRDSLEWQKELSHFLFSTSPLLYNHKVCIDSWNNIQKYKDVRNSFFIFDEQRVVGYGPWTKAFLEITKNNDWILLSATPGDTWSDYIPVFIANGFYRNKTQFDRDHVVYKRFSKYPQVDRWLNTGRLIRLRNRVLVDMEDKRHTVAHHEDIFCTYDVIRYKSTIKTRWSLYTDKPIKTASEYCQTLRRIVNSDPSRSLALLELVEKHPKSIIFYNFDYELKLLRHIFHNHNVAEWNGHKHQELPTTEEWVYLVQYTAGCEGWNCITTDTIIFYSQNYSYKVIHQAEGRINRINTPYTDLYYYHLKSRAPIDLAISRAIKEKKKFNETRFVGGG